jgi:hypothetical protein
MAKKERSEELRDGRGAVLWAPPLVVPAEVATWESRLLDASRGGTPDSGDAVVVPAREQGNAVPAQVATSAAQRRTIRLAALKSCRDWLIGLIQANPARQPASLRELAKEAKSNFGLSRTNFEKCFHEAKGLTKNTNWSKRGRLPGLNWSKAPR